MDQQLPDIFADYYEYSGSWPLLGLFCQAPGLLRLREAFAGLTSGSREHTDSDELAIYCLDKIEVVHFRRDLSLPNEAERPGSSLQGPTDGVIHWRGSPQLWELAHLRVEVLLEYCSVSCCHFLPGEYADDSHVCIEVPMVSTWETFLRMTRSPQ